MGVGVIAAGFSPAPPLAVLARYLKWPWPFLSDVERILYRRLGFPRARLTAVYSAPTLARYARAAIRGKRIIRPVEDTRQLGGDALLVNGRAIVVWRSRRPDERVTVDELLAAAREHASNGTRETSSGIDRR